MRFLNSSSTRRRVTIAVWLLGMGLATALIARRPTVQIRGIAWAEPVVLAAPSDGLLLDVAVDLHQPVGRGDLILAFDTQALAARRQVLLSEIEALTHAQQADRRGRDRLFERDREEAGLELRALVARTEESRAQLEALHERLAIDQSLFEQGVAPRERALVVRREINVVETRLAADTERLALARRSAERASHRAETAPGANQWMIETARRELDEIEAQIDQLVVRSPIPGQVTEIYRSAGEWLEAGRPVARISPVAATEVHAWLDSSAAPVLEAGATGKIRSAGGRRLLGEVLSAGVERLQMPRALWSRSDAPEWGYLVRLEIVEDVLAPGEPVSVALHSARD